MQAPRDGNFGFGIHPMGWPRRDASMTTRQYLDALAARAVVDVEELSRRYFVDFTRSDSVISTPVAVNIATLLKFFQDAFEQKPDPVHTIPDALRQPFVDFRMQHKAPFFLYFDEWEAQQEPVSLENFFQIRNIFHMENADVTLASFRSPSLNSADVTAQDRNTFTEATEIQIQLSLGYAQIDRAEWKSAQVTFEALQDRTLGFVWSLSRSEPNSSNYLDWSLRQKTALYSNSDLTRFEQQWVIPVFQATAANGNSYPLKYWINENKPKLLFSVRYLLYGILPVYKALIAQSLGDHAMACSCMMPLTDIIVRMGSLGLKTGWEEDFAWTTTGYNGNLIIRPHRGGEIPYTTTKSMEDRWVDMDDSDSVLGNRPSFHQIEQSYAKLVMGDILLEWADSIFQMNENSSIQRARELYKAVLMLYDIPLNLEPSWTSKHTQYDKGFRNPRVKSQIARARLGFEQIEAGLNFFGFEESTVPSLRYTVLKQAADAFIEAAKGVETDMINSISQLDSLTVEGMKTSAALERARMQTGIAAEQVELAQFQVSQMDQLVVNVNAQIAARKKEIEDHDSFGGQVGDFFKGFVGALGKMGSSALGGAGGAVKAEMGMGSMSDGGLMGLGAGASIMAGYAAFVYAGYMSMSSMSDAANDRTAQLEALKTKALPMAQKQVELSKRGVSIAQLNRSIAQSEVSLAQSLLDFADQRFLNSEFWLNLGNTLRRILRQYLTLGTRTAWLAERALSYEYQRNISIVRLNYYPSRQQGIGGADQLRADLAKVEAARLDSEAGSVPIKHTFSLARDFPLEFTLLRTTGKCSIRTSDATIQRAYPGMWGARIISLDAAITKASAAGAPLRGIVLQNGISQLSQNDGTLKPLVRPASALPISEFSLASPEAATVYGLPGSTLMPFEGTGTDAIWQLDFPAAGNPGGLGELIDVTLTTHLRASFSPNLYFQQSQIPPSLGNNAIVISAGRLGLRGLADLRNLAAPTNPPANAVLVFDLKNVFAIGGYKETNRVLRNLALLAITSPLENLSTNLVSAVRIGGQTVGVSMPADSGVAHSTNAPIVAPTGTPASPLNALSGISVDQVVEVVFERGPNAQAGVTRIKDFVLWIDYERFS
ncbi:hypothetical protein BU16DRAFT_196190 [Lophium mytilinum]|uniref:Tc toxin complex TcA C-terminal TcB-binding domain-containing protein n=1 Tax=Lophium mytilinum TaxID=390894 RepID=A0A6A6R9Y2_9PEZI|nr:hypothetical protein BU16DRAFT_196190 [Lophium mytilinum]